MIAGLIAPDAGRVLIEGAAVTGDTNPVKRKIGLVPQDLALYEELPAITNLQLFAAHRELFRVCFWWHVPVEGSWTRNGAGCE
jgi:ABC-type sugar transport system ATPase subunit